MTTDSTDHIDTVHAETGKFWGDDVGADVLRVVEFAGHLVPEGGLVLHPPFGGELTVWPDGQYVFTCPVPDDGGFSMVATHYSYAVEALDGGITVGSFAFGEQAPEESMPDFQSWSMDDILALEDSVGLIVDLPGPVAEFSGGSASGHVFSDLGLDLGSEFASDVLEHVIKTSCES
jgi:hypothetical protein